MYQIWTANLSMYTTKDERLLALLSSISPVRPSYRNVPYLKQPNSTAQSSDVLLQCVLKPLHQQYD